MPLTFDEADKLCSSGLFLLASRDIRCRLAALRKQALYSDAPEQCPNPSDDVARNVWISWKTLRGLPQSEAQIRYTFAVERVCFQILQDRNKASSEPPMKPRNPWDSWDTRRKSKGLNASAALWGGLSGMAPRKSLGQSILALVLIILVSTSDQACRFVLVTATPSMVGPDLFGLLAGPLFTVVNTVSGVLITSLADRSGNAHRVSRLAVGLSIWSTATLLTAFASNAFQISFLRIITASAQALCNPFCASLIADFFVEDRRGLALGVFSLGVYIGYGLALGPLSTIAATFGWRWAYVACGVFGLSILALLVGIVEEPTRGACDTFFRNGHDPKGNQWCQYCIGGDEGYHAVRGILRPGSQIVFSQDAVLSPRSLEAAQKPPNNRSPDRSSTSSRILQSADLYPHVNPSPEPAAIPELVFSLNEKEVSVKDIESRQGDDEKKNSHRGRTSLVQRWLSSRAESHASATSNRQEDFKPSRSPDDAKQSLLKAARSHKSRSRSPMVGKVLSKATTYDSAESLRHFLFKTAMLEESAKTVPSSNKITLGTKGTIVSLLPGGKAEVRLHGVSGKTFRANVHLLKRPLPTTELSQGSTVKQTACYWLRSPCLVLLSVVAGVLNTVGLVLADFIHSKGGGFFGPDGFRRASSMEILWLFSWMPIAGGCIGVCFGGLAHDAAKSATGRLHLLAIACVVSTPLAISVLFLPVPWAFLGFLMQQITGEMWPGIIMASIVDLSPPNMRSRIVAFHYFVTANTAGVAVFVVAYLTSRRLLNLQQALLVFYPGMLGLGAVLLIVCARLMARESLHSISVDTASNSRSDTKRRSLTRTGRRRSAGVMPSSSPSQMDDIAENQRYFLDSSYYRGLSDAGGPDTPLAPRIDVDSPRENSRDDARDFVVLSPSSALRAHSRRAISDRTARSDGGRFSESTGLLIGVEGIMSPAAANRLYGSFSPRHFSGGTNPNN